jgi:ubiquinone/menaquinone biosynthesis C-methylase UbiE
MMLNQAEMVEVFGPLYDADGFAERFRNLLAFAGTFEELLALTNIRYLAPADAAKLDLPSASIDYYVSYSTIQCIPPAVLADILIEGQRVLRKEGSFLWYVNMEDHFAHQDSSISAINYLRFSEAQWQRIAGNRFMYLNRLRLDDFSTLFQQNGCEVRVLQGTVDKRALEELQRGMPLDGRFADKSHVTNATTGAWLFILPRQAGVGGTNPEIVRHERARAVSDCAPQL